MLNNTHFYHEHVRKAIIAFGTIFNTIQIRRKNPQGEITQSLRVPLSYAPKNKIIARILEDQTFEDGRGKYSVTLPRMAFEITSLSYDASRKLVPMQTVRSLNAPGEPTKVSYVSTPYNMGINLSVFSKNTEDGLQIVEQIFPFFNPDFNVTINEIPELGVKRDIQFILDSVSLTDDYIGNFESRRSVVWDLNFTVKINFFGYVSNADLIRKTIMNIYNNIDTELMDPTVVAGTTITTTVSPENAAPTDNYTFIQEFDDLYPGA